MTTHDMTIEHYSYRRTYGYSKMSRLVCSCGFASQWGSGDAMDKAWHHQACVVHAALGLVFSVKTEVRKDLDER